jgi:hypothetical protein
MYTLEDAPPGFAPVARRRDQTRDFTQMFVVPTFDAPHAKSRA